MSEDKKPNNHATAWIVTLIALPVLYMLSWGPVMGLVMTGRIPNSVEPWLFKFYKPVEWVHKTPLEKPLAAYLHWWFHVLKKP